MRPQASPPDSRKPASGKPGAVHGDDPGEPGQWVNEILDNLWASKGGAVARGLLIGTPDEKTRFIRERRFGPWADRVLAEHTLSVTAESKDRLIARVIESLNHAALILKQNAEGDYRPDPNAAKYPSWESAAPKKLQATPSVSLKGLVEAWWSGEAKAANRASSTYNAYRTAFRQLAAFLNHDDANRVTPEDVVAFKEYRLKQINTRTGKPVSIKTINDSDLVALKSVFGWALRNRKVPSNPAETIRAVTLYPVRAFETVSGFPLAEGFGLIAVT